MKKIRSQFISLAFGVGLVILPEKPISNNLMNFESIQGETLVLQNKAAKNKQKKFEKAALDRLHSGIHTLPVMPMSGR